MTAKPKPDFPIEALFAWSPDKIDFPLDWTPEQAEAAIDILGRIEEKIWTLFGDDIIALQKPERGCVPFPDDFYDPLYDDIPF